MDLPSPTLIRTPRAVHHRLRRSHPHPQDRTEAPRDVA